MSKTVFVLGAGASFELGLPLGEELKTKIAECLNFRFNGWDRSGGSDATYTALRMLASQRGNKEFDNLINAAGRIRKQMHLAPSIDNFMDVHHDDSHINLAGKLAIADCILSAERKSPIFVDFTKSSFAEGVRPIQSWHTSFWRAFFGGVRLADAPTRMQSLAFVVFNYDRCIEQFLFDCCKQYYGIDDAAAAELLTHLEVHHAYGQVGFLPWKKQKLEVPYGANVDGRGLIEVANLIRTFTESNEGHVVTTEAIQTCMSKATVLVFLGFAFHPINMKLLFPVPAVQCVDQQKHAFSTAPGWSSFVQKWTKDEVCKGTGGTLENMHWHGTCKQLFDDYGMGIQRL